MTAESKSSEVLKQSHTFGIVVLLVAFRYRLLWAKTRFRRSRKGLFYTGYLLISLLIAMLMLSGFAAVKAAIRSFNPELLAWLVLGSTSTAVIAGGTVLGICYHPVSCDSFLRRYPVTTLQRSIARHLSNLLGPSWMVVLAVHLGIAGSFSRAKEVSGPLAMAAMLLVLLTNYLATSILSDLFRRAAATRAVFYGGLWGTVAILLFVFRHRFLDLGNRALLERAVAISKWTTPLAASSILAGARGTSAGAHLLVLVVWCAVLTGVFAALERVPIPSRSDGNIVPAVSTPIGGSAATVFGSSTPLLNKVLRYYVRSSRARFCYLMALPVLVFPLATARDIRSDPMGPFFLALGIMASVGFLSTCSTSINVFGFDGSGFRRYFLLPLKPATVLRCVSFVPLLLGAIATAVALPICLYCMRVQYDTRMVVMLLAYGIGGLFFFHAVGLWISLVAPSRSDFSVPFLASDLSWPANAAITCCIAVSIGGAFLAGHFFGAGTVLRYWWTAVAFALLGAVAYVLTLHYGATLLAARREHILQIVENAD